LHDAGYRNPIIVQLQNTWDMHARRRHHKLVPDHVTVKSHALSWA
jgi:hypothetical protein